MGALRLSSAKILRRRTEGRARAIKAPARSRCGILIVVVAGDEFRPWATLRRTLIHPIPSGSGTAIELTALWWGRHWRAHFISTGAKIPIVSAAWNRSILIHHAALMSAHSIGTLPHPRVTGTVGNRTPSLFHLRRDRHSRSSSLLAKAWTLSEATTIRLRSIGTLRHP